MDYKKESLKSGSSMLKLAVSRKLGITGSSDYLKIAEYCTEIAPNHPLLAQAIVEAFKR